MKKLVVLAIAVIAASSAAGAAAQKGGGGPLSVLLGGQGVASPDGKVRYVALTTGLQTIVSVVRVRGGQIDRWRLLPGYFGVPVISLDGATAGVSHDGEKLVLATSPGGTTTEFAVIDTRTLKLRRIPLRGLWSFDAIAPDASTLYLVQYSGPGSNAAYSVRAFDLETNRLLSRPIVDRDIGAELMRGWAVTRASSSNGRWAYTLYAKQKGKPFVHALDTANLKAYCIDLPLALGHPEQMQLRLRLRADRMLDVRNGRAMVATVDTRSFVVHRH
jgi:hypothetical protein